jgi:hypothetical protein
MGLNLNHTHEGRAASPGQEPVVAEKLRPLGKLQRRSEVGIGTVFAGAVLAGANRSQEIEAKNAGGVAVVEIDLQGVVADGACGLRRYFRLEHGQERRIQYEGRCKLGIVFFQLHVFFPALRFFLALVIAHRAWALFAQIREIVVAGMIIGPGDVDPRSGGHVHFHAGRFSSCIDRDGHGRAALFLGQRGSEDTRQVAFEFGAAIREISDGLGMRHPWNGNHRAVPGMERAVT